MEPPTEENLSKLNSEQYKRSCSQGSAGRDKECRLPKKEKKPVKSGVRIQSSDMDNTNSRHKFLTGSSYYGMWSKPLQCMDGYGIYTFPDGSDYRGYFQKGQFHGYGKLHLTEPYGFTYKGTFINGSLEVIEDMWFDDGLHVEAEITDKEIDFSKWKYCCKEDRRFAAEQREGIPAVGPFSYHTAQRIARSIPKRSFDIEGGIFHPGSGVILQRPDPLPKMHYVACKDELQWISKNCRRGSLLEKILPIDDEVSKEIVATNLKNETELAEHDPTCNYDPALNGKRYFHKLYEQYLEELTLSDCTSVDLPKSSDSSVISETKNALSLNSLNIDIHERLFMGREFDHLQLGRDLQNEASSLMGPPYQAISHDDE